MLWYHPIKLKLLSFFLFSHFTCFRTSSQKKSLCCCSLSLSAATKKIACSSSAAAFVSLPPLFSFCISISLCSSSPDFLSVSLSVPSSNHHHHYNFLSSWPTFLSLFSLLPILLLLLRLLMMMMIIASWKCVPCSVVALRSFSRFHQNRCSRPVAPSSVRTGGVVGPGPLGIRDAIPGTSQQAASPPTTRSFLGRLGIRKPSLLSLSSATSNVSATVASPHTYENRTFSLDDLLRPSRGMLRKLKQLPKKVYRLLFLSFSVCVSYFFRFFLYKNKNNISNGKDFTNNITMSLTSLSV